ncbi:MULTISPECIES: molybdenum cofactor guanylyltransferase MobA [Marinobacter]|jgi:molybdopterin-guanine dinucleotide biosynthesis protein A|uniref:Molybdenum cofactor guanylyltransferase n=2 Tax=Marinobacter TaxID=2742 RepID=A0A5M3PU67_9GAMM|nr:MULTISPECIES: molybdenum cofactor guanylyltransferase MobA [Marinobacter]MBO6810311.1 molybdenum cofactor guanylyltransferase MobA [Marinobacter sp.]MBO6873438.1 molybdenum cofactor guanylyltransferase MobA [Marinobacter sp.]ODM33787.1 molybdenum cofactor guanylyltransferase [Marinobacter adhaerens]QTN42210.1 molybdenum cofactor guanylyltransferase MobA [Marinobacter salsuginis]GBO86388.1 molybdenum cofactor guanylyltransferase [Marinobacter salsuginis]|tara:strand:- start:969 stop:1556 length:588 start_codon:yes stop_codon:yes gene_type:complete
MSQCAVILAGGQANRMGGGDKGRLMLGDQSLIQRVIERITPQVDAVVLNANGDLSRFDDLDLPVVADSIEGFPGPLAGVLAGMDWAAEQGHEWLISVAADTPSFPRDLAARLAEHDTPVVLAATPDPERGRLPQPTFGRWRVALRDDLRAALNEGVRKIRQWTQAQGETLVVFDEGDFFNINTPDDLAWAEQHLK